MFAEKCVPALSVESKAEKTEETKYSLFAKVTDKNEIYEKVINKAVEKFGSNYTFKEIEIK